MRLDPIVLTLALTVACSTPAPATASTPPEIATAATAPAVAATPDPTVPLNVGDAAPDIALELQDGTTVDLKSLAGKQVLVYFYPADNTPGCTMEAQGLRDGWADIQAAGLTVFGVSGQDAESHKAFIASQSLPFPLVVDTKGKVAGAFHVPVHGTYAARQSFLIGVDGKIKALWLDVNPREHAATILAAAKK